MQLALGSVLKLTRSAFGGLGSFRAPSIRRALPVLLGGLLCAVGSAAMAQQISGVSLTSTPTGGPTGSPNTVYIIGNTITIAIDYDADIAGDPGSPTLRFQIGSQNRTATCARRTASGLLCSYVVREGDTGNSIQVEAGDQLVGGSVPDRSPDDELTTLANNNDGVVDGVRLKLNDIESGGVVNGRGFNAGSTIVLTLQFGDGTAREAGITNSGTLAATLVLENAERAARYVSTDATRGEVKYNYRVVAGDNGALGLKLTGVDALADKNGNKGLATGWESTVAQALAAMPAAERRVDTRGPQVTQILYQGVADEALEDLTTSPDVPSVPINGGFVIFDVLFDEPVSTRDMTLRVTVGRTTVSTKTNCKPITPSERLRCSLEVESGWLDTDGLSTPANPLNYTSLEDDLGNAAGPAFAAQRFPDIKVDAVPPTITSATISVPRAELGSNVIVRVTFSENIGVAGEPTATISSADNLGGTETIVGGPAVYSSMSGRVVEFRAPIISLPPREDTKTSVRVTLADLTSTGITDLAGNPLVDDDVQETAAAKTGTVVSLKTEGAQYADGTVPRLERISLTSSKKVYGRDETIDFMILFSEPVNVTGGALLALKIGQEDIGDVALEVVGTAPSARYTASYELKGEEDGAISVSGVTLPDDGNSILDTSTIDVTRNYDEQECTSADPCPVTGRGWISDADGDSDSIPGRTETGKISKSLTGSARVDTTRPKVKSVTLLTNPAPGAVGNDRQRYYGGGETIRIQVSMDEDVTVGATEPFLKMSVGGLTPAPTAKFALLRGKRDLIFEYKVEDGRDRPDGGDCTPATQQASGTCHIALNGIGVTGFEGDHASIMDVAGNTCEGATVDGGTCGYTWPTAPSGNHGVDARLKGDQKLTPLEETTTTTTPAPAAIDRLTAITSGTPTNGFHKSGATITFTLSFKDQGVDITAPPGLRLDVGGVDRLARCSGAGTGVRSITCSYTVQSGDEDTNGISVTGLSGGTIKVGERDISRSLPSVSGLPSVDARAPVLRSFRITSSAGSDGTYTEGDNIVVSATFSEEVERQGTSDPSVPILVGDVTRTATLQSPNATSGGDTWVFSYKVVAGDNDADGVAIAANALKGALEDAAGNEATITHSAVSASTSHKVDTQGPSVTAVAVTGAGDNDLFLEGETITVAVTFDEEVEVETRGTNAVRVRFNIGTEQRPATYAGGDGTETLTFTYVVADGDTGQISLPADALQGEVEDAAGNEAGITPAVMSTPYTVDASAPMLVGAPSISSAPRTGDTYAVDETITLQVRFDEPVMVTGEPRLPMWVGERLRNIVVYTSGDGTDTLTFSYTVRNGDNDDDGVSVDANALRLPSGVTIQDVNGLTATIEHGEMPNQPGHKVDAIAPGIESVAITSTPASDDAYLIDEMIEVTVTFSEDIATDGTPTLGLMVGTGSRAAACAQGSAGTQLTCSYTVVANDFDADGVSVDANVLEGTIRDMVGNPATLTHEALEDDPAHKVYAAAPEAVRTIDRLSLAAGGGTNSLDLTRIFTGFQLSYAAETSNANVATATVSGTDLTVVSGMEGTARVTVTASNLAGEASASFDVLVATDPVETAVLNDALAAIGRSMLSSTASVIGSRFELAATGSQMALGGSRFGGSLSPQMQRFLAGNDPFALEERMSERALFSGSGSQQAYGGGYGLTADRLLTGTSFNMPLNAMGTGDAQFAVWGAGDLQSFEGEPDDGMYDGSSSSGYIGVDARGDGWLAGVSVSRSGAEADYDFDGTARVTGVRGGGTLETSVTAFHPYARLEVGADSEVWVIGGFGGGEADLSRTHVTGSQSSDLSMAMAVGGLRRALAMEFGGADLSLRGDAGFLSLETDSGMMAVDGLSASVSRLRLGLEAAWEGESATPFVEVSGRFDGGDGQTGGGLELAGGLRILNPESGFGLEAKGRILAMHTGDGYSESGIGVTASFEPGAAGRGITFRLSPRWGGSADSTDLFWDEVGNVRDASQYAYGLDRAQTWGVDAALGYGFGLRSMPGVVTPFGQMDVTGDQDQRIRVGVRYGLMQGLLGGTQVELSAERVDGEMHRVGETRVLVSGRARF